MNIFKYIKNVIKPSEPIDRRLVNWLYGKYPGLITIKHSPTGSAYYSIKLSERSLKVRISDHAEVFNSCHIYLQTVTNNPDIVILREKEDRISYVYTYKDVTKHIERYIQVKNWEPETLPVKQEVIRKIPACYTNLTYHKISDSNVFSKREYIVNNWSQFKKWYTSVISISINSLDGIHQNRLHGIFTMKFDYNKAHLILVNNIKLYNDINKAIDVSYTEIKDGKYDSVSVKAALAEHNTNGKKHLPVRNEYILSIIVNKKHDTWEEVVSKLQAATNVDLEYDNLTPSEKNNLKYIFTCPLAAYTKYDLFMGNYNANKCCTPEAIKKTRGDIGNPEDVYDYRTISKNTFLKHKEFNKIYYNSVFFTGLTKIDKKWNNRQQRASHAVAWRNVMIEMFPWCKDMPGSYRDALNKLCVYETHYLRIIESLLIAHEQCPGFSCSKILDNAYLILTSTAFDNLEWDFNTNKIVDISIPDNTDNVVECNKSFDDKDTFFTGLKDYNLLWDSSEYRVTNFNGWMRMMTEMFPWMSDEMLKHKIRYISGLDVQGGTKRIIEYMLLAHSDSPVQMKKNLLKKVVDMIYGKSPRHWEFENNCVKAEESKQKNTEVFVYHYDKPVVTISSDEWLDMYDKRTIDTNRLNVCLLKDIKNYARFTAKQQTIVRDLLSNNIPYAVCVNAVNECFNTTKTLQNGCNKLKKQYAS